MKKYFFSSELDLNLKISILATIGPGGLRAPGVLACAMHSLAIVITIVQSFFGPGGLRVPCVLGCAMRSLAIVITIVQSSSSSSSFSSVFCF